MILNSDEFHKVEGEIYKITNTISNKSYVGQTRTHRLNHGKYRPFGSMARFRDHVSEANSNKKNQSRYLNSSILKHGSDKFTCEKLLTCTLDELDMYESYYIQKFNTKFPNGYNLTNGGQHTGYAKGKKIVLDETKLTPRPTAKENVNLKRSDDTKKLISERLIEAKASDEHRNKMMVNSQKQHLSNKFEKYRNVTIDIDNIDKYIRVINNYTLKYEYVRVTIDKIRTNFVGKFESIEQIKERAKEFIKELKKWQCDQIAGTSLQSSLPLISGNINEDLS
jgi:group I intron endonuclease